MIFEALAYWQYKDLRWRAPVNTDHIRGRPTLTLTRSDLRSVARISPIAFSKAPDGWHPILLNDEANNEVADFDQRWFNMKLPAYHALYPFSIVWHDRDKAWVLGVARDLTLIGPEGEPFFTPEGPLSWKLSVAYRRLCIAQAGHRRLTEAANRLAEADLFEDLAADGRSRRRFSVIRVDRLVAFATSGEVPAVDVELAFAAAFSLKHMPDERRRALIGYRPTPTAPSIERQDAAPELTSLDEHLDPQGQAANAFLFNDDDTLGFGFSASGSIFRSG